MVALFANLVFISRNREYVKSIKKAALNIIDKHANFVQLNIN